MKTYVFYLLILIVAKGFGQSIPPDYKKPVVYISLRDDKGVFQPEGTGFFVYMQSEDSLISFLYLITAKHVIQRQSSDYFPSDIEVRINSNDGLSKSIRIPLYQKGKLKNVFFHNDATVDLAAIPIAPNIEVFNYKAIPTTMFFPSKESLDSSYVKEGTDVFYTGMFSNYQGYKKVSPIVRFGKVAMMPEERILWEKDSEQSELLLIETTTFGGNSGSPLFCYGSPLSINGTLTVNNMEPRLLGVIKGYYNEKKSLDFVSASASIPVATVNVGVTAVIPSYFLFQLLELPEVKALRIEEMRKLKKLR